MRKGTRVKDRDNFLGKGTVVKKDKHLLDLILVKWDKAPHKDYNLGKNPCFTHKENLIKIKKKKK